jgi:hypothetical protein
MAAKKQIKVVEHSGEEHVTEVAEFNAKEVYAEIKAAQDHASNDYVVVIGDVIIDSRSIKTVVPVK